MVGRLALLCALGALAALSSGIVTDGPATAYPPGMFDPGLQEVRPGDIVLRRGRDAVSAVVLASDPDSRFSHAGMLARVGGLLGVVHALPAEAAHPKGEVIVEPLASFLSPADASEYAVYRLKAPPGSQTAEVASLHALRFAREHRRFDDQFSLATSSRLYCSELVWRAFLEAGVDLVDGHFRHLAIPIGSREFVLPSSLAGSSHVTLILDSKREGRL